MGPSLASSGRMVRARRPPCGFSAACCLPTKAPPSSTACPTAVPTTQVARWVLTYLDLVGLSAASNLPIAGYSLGMRQRLGLASALIGEARTLVLDEPVNGLDIEGVKWMRDYLRSSAQSGRCILLSSHLLSELELVADRLVILADGVASRVGTLESLRADDAPSVLITCVDPAELLPHFIAAGAEAIPEPGQLRILGRDLSWVAGVVSTAPVQVTGILQSTRGIEEVYLEETAHAGSHLMNVEGLR